MSVKRTIAAVFLVLGAVAFAAPAVAAAAAPAVTASSATTAAPDTLFHA